MTDAVTLDALDEDEEPRRELSMPRVALLLLVVVALLGGAFAVVDRSTSASSTGVLGASWYAPYVDATLTPTLQFQDPTVNPSRQVALGFVVADPKNACAPSWGGAYGLDDAAETLNLDRRVAQYRNQGGEVLISFGGAANSELATTCTDVAALTAAYGSVLSRYEVTTVDFDIEGLALADTAATKRRAEALAAAQKSARAEGKQLAVWLTLPVATTGLAGDALGIVTTTLASGVDLAGVNVMTMNYGTPQPDMGKAVRSSLTATHDQLTRVYAQHGIADSAAEVWNRMGATPMIGQNDTEGERFTTADASRLLEETLEWKLGRVSMWSLNRDAQCGGSYAVVGVHSDTCSGTEQEPLGFSTIFGALPGAVPVEDLSDVPSTVPTVPAGGAQVVPDDPATSPFPLWQPNRPYETGYKVVREGNVYQAKWYTRGEDPAAGTGDGSQSPWQIIGPVLPGEKPAPLPTVAPGTYPKWSPDATYEAGDRVLYNQLPFEAKWYSVAVSPGAQDADPAASPWKPLFTVPGQPK
jgi:chitinase